MRYTPSSSSQPKSEDSEPSTPDLLYADPDATSYPSTASPAEFAPQWDDSHHHPYTMAAAYGYESVAESYAAETAAMRDYYPLADDVHGAPQDAGAVYHDFHPDPHQPHPASVAAASVHAPRPVRCSGSPPFLTPEERLGAFAMQVDAAQGMPANPMLIDLAAGAPAPAPQISIPQVPAMPSPTEPTLAEAAVESVFVFVFISLPPLTCFFLLLQVLATGDVLLPGRRRGRRAAIPPISAVSVRHAGLRATRLARGHRARDALLHAHALSRDGGVTREPRRAAPLFVLRSPSPRLLPRCAIP